MFRNGLVRNSICDIPNQLFQPLGKQDGYGDHLGNVIQNTVEWDKMLARIDFDNSDIPGPEEISPEGWR